MIQRSPYLAKGANRMLRLTIIFGILACWTSNLFGQAIAMNENVSLNYRNVRLEDALEGISEKYQVNFSYSKHYIPVDKRVSLRVENVPLEEALDQLFFDTNVIYAFIGDQVVLRKSKKPKKKDTGIFDPNVPLFGSNKPQGRAIDRNDDIFIASDRPEDLVELPSIENYNLDWIEVMSEAPEESFDVDQYYAEIEQPQFDPSKATAQISLVPNIGTNMEEASERTNNVSFNVLGGENGGVEGVEIGGLFNKVKNDVHGVQIAGLFNSVGGDVGPSKIIDGKDKETFGVQIAGLVNTATNAHAVQFGGLMNVDRGGFKGFQTSGLGNIVGHDASGLQISGGFNVNGGDAGVQMAGLINYADDVYGGQMSGLFNRAKKVEGSQLALINVCDTVSGASIGLFNFVWKGYNQLEIGTSETMHTQAAIRFGSFRFYNIIQFGAQFNEVNDYSIGYGIGINPREQHYKRWHWNTELVASQVIENNKWRGLNLLTQFRTTAEFKVDRWFSLYLGPTVNIMFTDLLDKENKTSSFGTEIPVYTLFETKQPMGGTIEKRAWIGFRAGMRFGRNQ